MNQLFSTVDLAQRLGIAEHRIAYAHRTGKLADASFLVANKRVYTEADMKRVADYFGVPMTKKEAHLGGAALK